MSLFSSYFIKLFYVLKNNENKENKENTWFLVFFLF